MSRVGSGETKDLTMTEGNQNCDMPECTGDLESEVHAVRGPGNELLEVCNECLEEGWKQVVELLD